MTSNASSKLSGNEIGGRSRRVARFCFHPLFELDNLRVLELIAVQHDGHRAVIVDLDLHQRAEDAVLHLQHARLSEASGVMSHERLGGIRLGGLNVAGTAPLARIGVKRELRDDQDGAGDIQERADSSCLRCRRRRADSLSSSPAFSASASVSECVTPTKATKPAAISPVTSPSTVTDPALTRCSRMRMEPRFRHCRMLRRADSRSASRACRKR